MNTVLGYHVQEIFDPVQTHCAYNISQDRLDEVQERLREQGGVRFRKVKNGLGNVNLCFKLKRNAQ